LLENGERLRGRKEGRAKKVEGSGKKGSEVK
jgi:hypothetical protein